MYLKSLVLKGFKSFADRSVLNLEPGITVIVGPNGSGKSNISDSLLWVLGEQSAKTLRGQAMEDVIFSGSSARQAIGIAEVDIVLDNSCGTLPLDFKEVAITRRMYRSGESDYLINGSPVLLRDIRDVLHDSGIGRDAQSIISQGSLGTVLQSRPEERRALIEEAAGILKHKKRKERANRNLASMDAHLLRVNDIAKEIERQLRPLEKQAARAQQYKQLSNELKDLELRLAVDDLKALESVWKSIEKQDKEADAEVALARYRYSEKERNLEHLQKTLEEKGLFVGDLAEQRRRCQSVLERLDSRMQLLSEKGNNMVSRTSELRGKIYQSETRLVVASAELEQFIQERGECIATIKARTKELAELGRKSEAIRKSRTRANEEYQSLQADIRGKQRAIDDCNLKIEKVKQSLKSTSFEEDMLKKRLEQIDEQQGMNQKILAARRGRLETLDKDLEKNRRDSELAKFDIDKRVRLLEMHQNNLKIARESQATIRAEIKGIEEVDRAFEAASPALSWILTHENDYNSIMKPISEMFEASKEYETLVERLLGADIFGLVIEDSASAALLAERLLKSTDGEGEISIIPLEASRSMTRGASKLGRHLLSELRFDKAYAPAAEALLGDVYIVPTIQEAIHAHTIDTTGARFATKEGAVVWPNGKITLGAQMTDTEGVLARRRRLDLLQDELENATAALSDAELAANETENALTLAQQDGFELSTQIAMLQGESDSIREEVGRLEQTITRVVGEREEINHQLGELAEHATTSQPLLAELEQRVATIQSNLDALEETVAASGDKRSAWMNEESQVRDDLSKCNVDIATSSTRELYLKQRVKALEEEVRSLKQTIQVSHNTQSSLDILYRRVEPLYHVFEELSIGVKEWAVKLREQASLEQSDSTMLADTINEARDAVKNAKDELDSKIEALTDIRINKGKIETQVEAAVKSIVEDNNTVLERALDVPSIEDRTLEESRAMKLRRKIESIGLVNHVAMQEYETLKARRDYINEQLNDLNGARTALAKIVAAIDRKMRNQFLETYEVVDGHFQEIFGMLFPGGNAHLTLTDPDHPEATGVEIHAQPLGKKITKTTLMSGGEKSLTALALLFAVYRTRAVPFYVLDEVDDALDDTNLRRLVTYLDSIRHETQFLIVTHARRTMEMADVLYGVSMQADGVSKVVSQKLQRAIADNANDATPEDIQAAIDLEGSIVRPILKGK